MAHLMLGMRHESDDQGAAAAPRWEERAEMNPAVVNTILAMAEDSEVPADDIAAALGLDAGLVRGVLSAHGREGKAAAAEDVSDADLKEAFRTVRGIMRSEDASAHSRLAAARFLIDEKKGRNDADKGVVPGNINIMVINQRLLEAQSRKAAALTGGVNVDVPPVVEATEVSA